MESLNSGSNTAILIRDPACNVLEKIREARVIYKARGFHTERLSYDSNKSQATTRVKRSAALLENRITHNPAQHGFIDRCSQAVIETVPKARACLGMYSVF